MEGYGSTLADFYRSTSNAAKASFNLMAQLANEARHKVEHGGAYVKSEADQAKGYAANKWTVAEKNLRQKLASARQAVSKKLQPQPAGASIQLCPKNRKAERVAERKSKIAKSNEKLKVMPPGKQRDVLAHAERFERNNLAVERARLANDTYNVGQGDPPEGWERVSGEDLKKLGMTKRFFPQMGKGFRPSEYKDGYYPELYKSKADVFDEEHYVLSFRGTQGLNDGAADLIQALGGETDQYTRAIKTAQKLKSLLGNRLDIPGHSMGGGMATAAGIVAGKKVYAIDPAGVHPATMERFGKEYNRDSAKLHVQNYVAEGEILDTVQHPGSQRAILAGITSITPTGGAVLIATGNRAMLENGTVTFSASGPIYKVPILANAMDVLDGKTQQGLSPGLGGRFGNHLNPLQKIKLHNPKYVIAGMEQQKTDDLHVMDRSVGG